MLIHILLHSCSCFLADAATDNMIKQHLFKYSEKPNIVLMMADDLGWADISPNNQNIDYTPNLEALASEGIRYTDYHSAASVCTPSRAGLLTGRLGQRTGVISNFGVNSEGGLPLTEHTMAEYLRSAGYNTGIIGKWHLGHHGDYHPLARGFDYYFGLPYSNDMGCILCSPAYNIKVNPQCGKNRMFNLSVPLFENTNIIQQPVDLTTLTARYIESAQKFMASAIERNNPFFLYVPMTHVHVPLATDKRFANKTGHGHLADTIMEMDSYVGSITKFLKDQNVLKNTIVIFTSDNGPWEYKCNLAGSTTPFHGVWQKTQGGGGTSSKMSTWEGGHRVPFIISWPEKLPGGITKTDLVSALDLLPTFAMIANFTLQDDREYDGIPFPFLVPHTKTRALFLPDVDLIELWSLRYGQYKVYYATTPGDKDCQDSIGKGFLYHNPALVFDISTDPQEGEPLSMSDLPASFYHNIELLKKSMRDSIYTTMRSSVNWNTDDKFAACCNKNNPYCAC